MKSADISTEIYLLADTSQTGLLLTKLLDKQVQVTRSEIGGFCLEKEKRFGHVHFVTSSCSVVDRSVK